MMGFYSLYNCLEAYIDFQERTLKIREKEKKNLEHNINFEVNKSRTRNMKNIHFFSLTEYYYDFGHR